MKIKKVYTKISKRYAMIKAHPLASKNGLLALFRYFKFNIIQYLNPKPRIYSWVNGLHFYAEKGDAGIVGNIYYQLMDYEESMFVLKELNKNDLFVDAGANVGHFTLLAAGVANVEVIAVEPIKNTFLKLKKNVDLNELSKRVKLFNIGLSDTIGTLHFINNMNVMNKVSNNVGENTTEVEVTTLDILLKDQNPTLIKIDVEGFEYFVLKGAKKVLRKPSLKFLMIEFNNSGKSFGISDDEVFKFVLEHGFIPVKYDVENSKLVPISGYNTSKFNTLFVKEDLKK